MTNLEITNNKELRINSVELVEIINEFRRVESEALEKKYVELQHKDFLKKIRNELGILKLANVINEGNISLVNYIDSKGESRPCYSLNRDGMLQMLNSESVLVRAKTIEHISKLEEHIKNQVPALTEKQQCILAVYDGGEQALLGAKKLAEIEVKQVMEELEPTLEEYKQFMECPNGCVFMDEYSKTLGLGRNKLYEILRELQILQTDESKVEKVKGRRHNLPYEKYMKYFEVKFAVKNDRKFSVILINNEGQSYIFKRLKKEGVI